MKKLVLIVIFSLYTFAGIAQLSNNKILKKEKELWTNVAALNKAVFETKDSSALKQLLRSDVTYGHSNGSLEDKAVMIKKAVTSPTRYENISLEKLTVRFVKKTAIVRHTLRATSIENNISSPLDLSILQVWIKQKGDWKLLGRQAVRIPPATK